MSKVAVVVDSTAFLPPELVEQYDLRVIPQILNWEGESYKDDIDIKPDAFYARLKTAKEMPTTSQPSAGEFVEFFSEVAKTADSIVAVLISEHLSGTLASARAAKDMMPDASIEIVDSRSTVMGLGFIALAAARAIENGADHKEAAEAARALVPHMRIVFVVDTLEFLHRGGRIGSAKRFVGSMLSIKPLLHIADGKIEPLASVRTKRKAIAHMLNHMEEEMKGKSNVRAAVMNAVAPDEAAKVVAEVEKRANPKELLSTELSPVIGTHAGPGTVGVIYYAEP
ncbi:MAG: DegV family protein [Chloroflexi bacterium]|nr:DegV family protein [Chloroflexota bacterium]